jgi:hypothetical protein
MKWFNTRRASFIHRHPSSRLILSDLTTHLNNLKLRTWLIPSWLDRSVGRITGNQALDVVQLSTGERILLCTPTSKPNLNPPVKWIRVIFYQGLNAWKPITVAAMICSTVAISVTISPSVLHLPGFASVAVAWGNEKCVHVFSHRIPRKISIG